MTLNEIQDQIVEEFEVFDEWMDKYQYLIDLSKNLEPLEESEKTQKKLIEGCQSRVWVDASFVEGKVVYRADSDASITKGIIAMLIRVLNRRTPDEIVATDLYFIEQIGLKEHLSPTRSNGLLAMIKQMKLYALAFKTMKDNLNK